MTCGGPGLSCFAWSPKWVSTLRASIPMPVGNRETTRGGFAPVCVKAEPFGRYAALTQPPPSFARKADTPNGV